jgi:hypothetical protein
MKELIGLFFFAEILLGFVIYILIFVKCLVKIEEKRKIFSVMLNFNSFVGRNISLLPGRIKEYRKNGGKINIKVLERVFAAVLIYWFVAYKMFEIYEAEENIYKKGEIL